MSAERDAEASPVRARVSGEAELLALALQSGNAAAWEYGAATGKISWAAASADVFGRPCAEITSLEPFLETLDPDEKRALNDAISGAVQEGKPYRVQFKCIWPNGEAHWLEARGTFFPEERVLRGITVDVTAARASQQSLVSQEQELRTLLDSLPDVISRYTPDLRYAYISSSIEKHTGLTPGQVVGKSHDEIGLPPELAEKFNASLRKVFATGSADELTFTFEGPLGLRHYAGMAVPEKDGSGAVTAVLTITRDVTERQQAQEALRVSEEWYRMAVTAGDIGVWDWDLKQKKVTWSARIYEIFGVQSGQFDGSIDTFDEQVHPRDRARVEKAIEDALADRAPYALEFSIVRPDGSERIIATRAQVLRDADGIPARMLGVTIDVTERRMKEREVQDQKQQLDYVLESTTDAVFLLDRQWRFTYLNSNAFRLIAQGRSLVGEEIWEAFPEAVGTAFWTAYQRCMNHRVAVDFEEYYPPLEKWFQVFSYPAPDGIAVFFHDVTERRRAEDERRSAQEQLELAVSAANVGTWSFSPISGELWWSDRTYRMFGVPVGTKLAYEVFEKCVLPEDRAFANATVQKALDPKGPGVSDMVFRIVLPDGTIRHIASLGKSMFEGAGAERHAVRFTGTVLDVTERRSAEEALIRTEKLAAAGRLAATVAHEINNPLAAVTNLVYLARTSTEATEGIRSTLNAADEELRRVAHIVRQTLGFYRENTTASLTGIAEIVRGVVELFDRRLHGKNIVVAYEIDESVVAKVSAGELRQVLSNLVSNAIDAMDHGGRLVVTLKREGKDFLVKVRDNGPGIPQAVRARLFEPFLTTKKDVGTGLGLWVSKGIVEKHGGTITVDTSTKAETHGTTFVVRVPVGA